MRDFITLGQTPCSERCANVGEPNYRERARAECQKYIQLLRQHFGPEPLGAHFAIKWFDHDFGPYYEVVCFYDSINELAREYALRCEDHAPMTWYPAPTFTPILSAHLKIILAALEAYRDLVDDDSVRDEHEQVLLALNHVLEQYNATSS